ncbi:MAG: adenosylcobinamide-GDP ribazoletransferase [Chloroflexota bacterium]
MTIIRVPGRRDDSPENLGRSVAFFPVAGGMIGLALAGFGAIIYYLFPASVASVLIIVFLAVVTGGLHLDGLIDTCDGIGGHHTINERWRIMRDSRVGAFGVIGAVLIILLQYASLNILPDGIMPRVLVLMPVISRWGMVYAIWAYPYAHPDGLGRIFKDKAGLRGFIFATFTTLGVAVLLFQFLGVIIMLGTWLITVTVATYLKSRFAGLTGDCYGAINEIAEVSVLILIAIMIKHG